MPLEIKNAIPLQDFRNAISTSKVGIIQPWKLALLASQNMASNNVNTGNWAWKCAAETYTEQTMLSKVY